MKTQLHVSYLGLVRNVIGLSEEDLEVLAGVTVGQLLAQLTARHGLPFKETVFKQSGELRSMSQVCVEDCDIDDLDGLDTKIDNGENVSIVVGVYPPEGG
ncbi:MAG TPA: MoaD/ThiS family protein [Candidatus Binatia bacterium]|jgi:molybdopterin converting factor small subunit